MGVDRHEVWAMVKSFLRVFAGIVGIHLVAPLPDSRPEAKRLEEQNQTLIERKDSLIKLYPGFDSALYHMKMADLYSDSIDNKERVTWLTNKKRHDSQQNARLRRMSAHLDSMNYILYRCMQAAPVKNKQPVPGVLVPIKR